MFVRCSREQRKC